MTKEATEYLVDAETPRARVALLLEHFSHLEDGREPQRVMYPLSEVLLLVTCATIASCDDFDEIEVWGTHYLDFLRQFSPFYFGIPCDLLALKGNQSTLETEVDAYFRSAPEASVCLSILDGMITRSFS